MYHRYRRYSARRGRVGTCLDHLPPIVSGRGPFSALTLIQITRFNLISPYPSKTRLTLLIMGNCLLANFLSLLPRHRAVSSAGSLSIPANFDKTCRPSNRPAPLVQLHSTLHH
jgi:hypothetical protein